MTDTQATETIVQRVLAIAKQVGVIRPRDLEAHGIPGSYLSRLAGRGLLEKVGRGLYRSPDAEVTEHHSLVEAIKAAPNAVVCLLSALRFHALTTQAPFQVWLALPERAWRPKIESLPIRFVKFSAASFEAGIEEHMVEGVQIRVYSAAKTVADCFKYRNKIGIDVALEAIRECWQNRQCSADELTHYGKICRVWNVMRPYIEAIL
ncbi:MAG: type IV toxin-antitoxin system AbiEi family antitoxin domain-containing protein [Deltaproteobacteria bacterium]|jgi:predicted transcriptional regulator of viral defense system